MPYTITKRGFNRFEVDFADVPFAVALLDVTAQVFRTRRAAEMFVADMLQAETESKAVDEAVQEWRTKRVREYLAARAKRPVQLGLF